MKAKPRQATTLSKNSSGPPDQPQLSGFDFGAGSLRAFAESWLTSLKTELAPQSWLRYKQVIGEFTAFLSSAADRDLIGFGPRDDVLVKKFRDSLADRLAPAEREHCVKVVKQMFKTASQLQRHAILYDKLTRDEFCEDVIARVAKKSAHREGIGDVHSRYTQIIEGFRCRLSSPSESEKKKRRAAAARLKKITDAWNTARLKTLTATRNAAWENRYNAAYEDYLTAAISKQSDSSLSLRLKAHCQTNAALSQVIRELKNAIEGHLRALKRGEPAPEIEIRANRFPGELTSLLADEWLRDKKALTRLLRLAFKHWRDIDDPEGIWRRRLVIHQSAEHTGHDRSKIVDRLARIGAIRRPVTEKIENSARLRIGQLISRDLRSVSK